MIEHHCSCHCGRVHLVLRDEPAEVNECNCSICRRTAGLWHYRPPRSVTVEGEGVRDAGRPPADDAAFKAWWASWSSQASDLPPDDGGIS